MSFDNCDDISDLFGWTDSAWACIVIVIHSHFYLLFIPIHVEDMNALRKCDSPKFMCEH